MRVDLHALIGMMVLAGPALAEQKVFGEASIAYGQTDFEDLDDTADQFSIQGGAAFVSDAGLGIQLGANYTNVSVNGGGEADTYSYDAHIYGDAGAYKLGAFISELEVDEIEIYGLGSEDADLSVTSYGLEGQGESGAITYRGYVARADIDDTDNLLYGFGADFDVTPDFELSADYDAMDLSIDGLDEELEVGTFSLGAGYYLQQAPVRLSVVIGRTNFEYDGMDADATNFGIGATYLFGGRADASRERLFKGIALPF